ncbi:Uncharacterised protein [Salmonella enterica subsp. arizonae]|uniref:Uncharacterized protein n=1 Tax=Salmonella enterica subsp. arizonae TaxID=59203 RepID=A0A3S4GW76_SALER|nr:Uncharacterised protein [Salmonella enterica subsp. arizonae]
MGRYNIFEKEITQTEFCCMTITYDHLMINQSDNQLSASVITYSLSFTQPG